MQSYGSQTLRSVIKTATLTRPFSATSRSFGSFLRPVPLDKVPETHLEPLSPSPATTSSSSSSTQRPSVDPITHLLALKEANELPPNIRLQNWVDDRKRWEKVSKDERDGVREKGGRGTGRPFGKGRWIKKGLRDLLKEQ